jgi:predicted RecB family nuclease
VQINGEILNCFIYCKYKAFRKYSGITGTISEYQKLYSQLKETLKLSFGKKVSENNKLVSTNSKFDKITYEDGILLNLRFTNTNIDLTVDGFEILDKKNFILIFITPFEHITKYDKQLIALQSYYLQNEFNIHIEYGKVIYGNLLNQTKFKLSSSTKSIKKLIDDLNKTISNPSEPSLVLNNHCIICEYHAYCMEKAKAEDNISLLDRATNKVIEKYKRKGIFTIQQLSYLYKPRRRKKQKAKQLIIHNLELQALAIRTDRILVQLLPELFRHPIELFLDIEGNPDHETYYLIGLIVSKNQKTTSYTYWADRATDEVHIWHQFLSLINEYPDSPVFHYGNYDSKAIDILGKRYNTSTTHIQPHIVNISNSIFGKIYFPVYSNKLKELGNYIGATWTSNNASGIQSLVWRHLWEETHDEKFKQMLITYNLEDCNALKLLTDKLFQIQESASVLPEIDFVINPKKRTSPVSSDIHQQFDKILKFAHENYDHNKISFQSIGQHEISGENKVGGKIGHKGVFRTIPKAKKIIIVPVKRICPIHKCKLTKSPMTAEQTLTDLVFTKNAIRKRVVKYVGHKSYCLICGKYYIPTQIEKIRGRHFGRDFKVWVVYQRLFLRLPFEIIKLNLMEMLNENISQGSICNIFKPFSSFYKYTESQNLKQILKSPFIHVDETQINVKGVNHYVWIFTNGKQVVFRETESREISMVVEFLREFKGILISDFYPGYDSLKCKHQKCWVHLIRDLNDDLWENPYDIEYEKFMVELKNLIIPIFASIEKYGSKKRHFNKFIKNIDEFYNQIILNENYNSEIVLKYQTRFKKHWANLFTFLDSDNIPWNNNMAERGIRHLAVQRKISTFFDKGVTHYLSLLGIMQTCKFQNKSFLKFLLSGKKNI